jgi:hypothetical protein
MKYKLVNKDENREATERELKYLRVSSEGIVEKAIAYANKVDIGYYQPDADIKWKPAPEWKVIVYL